MGCDHGDGCEYLKNGVHVLGSTVTVLVSCTNGIRFKILRQY